MQKTNFVMDVIRDQPFDCFVFQGNIDIHAETCFKDIPVLIEKSLVKLDFSQVGRINSMGIALLLRCFKKIRDDKKAEILLTGLNTIHTMLFKTTGVFLLASLDNNP
jgi:anti-anti-sigma regulatory factor